MFVDTGTTTKLGANIESNKAQVDGSGEKSGPLMMRLMNLNLFFARTATSSSRASWNSLRFAYNSFLRTCGTAIRTRCMKKRRKRKKEKDREGEREKKT
jgi:hypothetical protein